MYLFKKYTTEVKRDMPRKIIGVRATKAKYPLGKASHVLLKFYYWDKTVKIFTNYVDYSNHCKCSGWWCQIHSICCKTNVKSYLHIPFHPVEQQYYTH